MIAMCAIECVTKTAPSGAAMLESEVTALGFVFFFLILEPSYLNFGYNTQRVSHRPIKIYCTCFGSGRELEAIKVSIGGKEIIKIWWMNTTEYHTAIRNNRLDIDITTCIELKQKWY